MKMKLSGNTFMINEGKKAARERVLLCDPILDKNVIYTCICIYTLYKNVYIHAYVLYRND